MIKKMIVTTDGVNLIGRVKQSAPAHWKTRGGRSEKSRKFDKYYYEAQYAGIPEKEIPDYIQMRFIEDADDIINDALDDVEFEELWKNFQNRFHKRLVRYRQKLLMLDCNYFVTFTYDDKKESAEGFEKGNPEGVSCRNGSIRTGTCIMGSEKLQGRTGQPRSRTQGTEVSLPHHGSQQLVCRVHLRPQGKRRMGSDVRHRSGQRQPNA